jgi:hypothetical protein
VHAQVSWLELGDDLTSGPRSSAGGGLGGYPFGFVPGWAMGQIWSGAEPFPHGLFFFPIFFPFSFFDLPFLLYSLQKCFKTIQTIFRNFLKISTLF